MCFVAAFCLQAFLALPKLSATSDEVFHLAAGYSYWQTRDFRMNPEHPPFAKLLATVPLLAIGPKLDTSDENWEAGAQGAFGFEFLYQNDADRLLFWARTPMVLVAALGAVVTFLWARDLFGPVSGLFALGLYAFSPNLLGHGMLVTTDVPLAVFSTLTLYLFWKQGSSQSRFKHVWLGVALGCAMASKFSGAMLPILLAGLAGLRAWHSENRIAQLQAGIKGLSITAAVALLVIEATYLFSASPFLYFKNASLVNVNHNPEYFFYLFGHLKQGGWWYYFPLAFAVKATLPLLILVGFATLRTTQGLIDRWAETILLVSIVFYTVAISLWAHPIGIRYLLTVFPLLFVWVSRTVPHCLTVRWGRAIPVVLIGWQVWAGVSAFPNYIPYFNELAGGPARGIDYLDDSNVDWGQGLKQAAQYVRERRLEKVAIYSFSPLDNPEYYGLPANLRAAEISDLLLFKKPPPGVYVISTHRLVRMRQFDEAWRLYTPIGRIGESLWVYLF